MFDQTFVEVGDAYSNKPRATWSRLPHVTSPRRVELPPRSLATASQTTLLCPTPQLFSLGSNSEYPALFRFIPPRLYGEECSWPR